MVLQAISAKKVNWAPFCLSKVVHTYSVERSFEIELVMWYYYCLVGKGTTHMDITPKISEIPRIPTAKLEKKKNVIFPQFRQKRIGSHNSDK
jgi:hypothetical protein